MHLRMSFFICIFAFAFEKKHKKMGLIHLIGRATDS